MVAVGVAAALALVAAAKVKVLVLWWCCCEMHALQHNQFSAVLVLKHECITTQSIQCCNCAEAQTHYSVIKIVRVDCSQL